MVGHGHVTHPPSRRLGMSPEHVAPSDREKTKRVVYSVIYGMGMSLCVGVVQLTSL